MPLDLTELVAPGHTAVVTSEVQRGVVGDSSALPDLARVFRGSGAIACAADVVKAARGAGVRVVHCVAHNRGVRTVVAVGVSVNIAIPNLAFDAVNAGYQVVIPRDAVAGVPPDYAEAVLENTLSLVATLTTSADLVRIWKG